MSEIGIEKWKVIVMIDLFSATIDVPHKSFGSERIIRREDQSGGTKYLSKKCLINQVPIYVTSLNNGKQINIRCCPLKVLQGHNIFGSNRLKKLWRILIPEVLNHLSIKVSEEQLDSLMRGEFQIDEIHLTHRFPVGHVGIKRVVSHIHHYSSMSLAPSIIKNGIGVTLTAPHHLAEWIFYDKCLEFEDKRSKEHKYLVAHAGIDTKEVRHLLHKLASKSIRAELKLDKKYLKKNGLDRGKCWMPDKIIELYQHELSLLRLGEIPSLPELPEMYKQIDDAKLRSVVILWANGEDLSDHFGLTTFEKYRREIRDKLGIDIQKDHPLLKPAHIKLSDIFDPSNMLAGFPKWVRKYPALAFR